MNREMLSQRAEMKIVGMLTTMTSLLSFSIPFLLSTSRFYPAFFTNLMWGRCSLSASSSHHAARLKLPFVLVVIVVVVVVVAKDNALQIDPKGVALPRHPFLVAVSLF